MGEQHLGIEVGYLIESVVARSFQNAFDAIIRDIPKEVFYTVLLCHTYMSDEFSLEEINSTLLRLESEYNLLERQSDDVYYWERVRHSIHKKIIRKIQKVEKEQSENENSKRSRKIKRYTEESTKALKNLFRKNPYLADQSEIIFYGKGRRRQLNDGTWYDMHLDPIAEMLDETYTFIEPTGGPPQAPSKNRRFLKLPRFVGDVAQKLGYSYELPEEERDHLQKFESAVEDELGVSIDAISRVERELSNRKLRLPMLNKIVQRIDPKICFMTYGHSHHSTFIEACHNQDVTVVDVQYCAVDPNYWPYHYPGDRQRRVKPDHLLLWGEFWKEAADLPFADNELYISGFPYFERRLKEYKDTKKKEQVLFVSNSKSGPHLSKLAAELAKTGVDKEIVYKLHGGEFETWQSNYPELAEVADQGNVTVLDEVEGSLHKLLAESQVQVGVSSTALYEGLAFNLPTYILNVPYSYEMQRVTEAGQAELVDDVQALSSKIGSLDTITPDTDLFFKQGSQDQLDEVLSQIL